MRRSLRAVLALVVVVLTATACGQSQSRSTALRGTLPRSMVLGRFVGLGGQRPAGPGGGQIPWHPVAGGRIVARSQTGQSFVVAAARNGHFQMLVPPGLYRVTGYPAGSHAGCDEKALTVRAGERQVRIVLACIFL